MKAITLRNLPPRVAQIVQRRARTQRVSLNRAVIELLEECAGPKNGRSPTYSDLDYLAGTWTRSEAAIFEKSLREQRSIDEEIWK